MDLERTITFIFGVLVVGFWLFLKVFRKHNSDLPEKSFRALDRERITLPHHRAAGQGMGGALLVGSGLVRLGRFHLMLRESATRRFDGAIKPLQLNRNR
jgi:hypothetical protein